MTQRICMVDGCERPHQAKGYCGSCYSMWWRKNNRERDRATRAKQIVERTCVVCETKWMTNRRDAKFCTDACKGQHYTLTMRRKSPLPSDHPVMQLIASEKRAQREAAAERKRLASLSKFEWRTARECPGCACWFTPLYTPNMLTCSMRCSRRVHRWRRNAAERDAIGSFTWSEFMRIAARFNYCCAYCGTKPTQLDPDHVVPLSRGGSNSTTNLLPSCHTCNGDKRDLLLDEWAADREQRAKPPRATNWPREDKRYWHLTDAMLISPAA
jgi:hypothetical protein